MLEGGHRFENIAAFVVMMACLSFGLRRVRRERHAAGDAFTFGLAFKHAAVIAALGGLVNALGQYLYIAVIHPAYADHFRAALIAGSKLTPEQAAASQAQLDFIVSPLFRAINQGGTTLLFTLFVGIAYALLFRDRPAAVGAASPRA
ncbi:MAG: DUF4199 domain-containing protein [Opitutaceae bacterium]|nr:DUF4199 domain-containing protein [Opitutaceae bacterium]